MARALYAGVQPSEYARLTPGAYKALLSGYERHKIEDSKAWAGFAEELAAQVAKAVGTTIVHAANAQVKALDNLMQLIAKRPTL